MKKFLIPLAAVVALSFASTASARVLVHVGPVTVSVGGRPHRPNVGPVVGAPHPVFLPGQGGGWSNGHSISPHERRDIREEARELRHDIRDAGPVVSPRERREIRDDVRDLQREIRQAWRD